MSPLRALGLGLLDVLRAPLLVAAIALVMLVIALPFAAALHSRLQDSLSVQPHVSLADTEIDAEWWMEFREHARGLAATFTPAVLGFAATLDGLSAVMDGRRPQASIVAPVALSIVAWAFLWGGILHRFREQRGLGMGGFLRAGARHAPGFIAIAVVAAIVNILLYLTVHRILFGPVHGALAGMVSTERDAFLIRVVLYLIFFSLVAVVTLVADYARVAAVACPERSRRAGGETSPAGMLRAGAGFVRARASAVIALYAMTAAVFVLVTVAYGVLEIYGGSQVGGWRAVAIGQAYVLVRLGIRLSFAASELRLFTANHTAAAE